eukprot:1844149-Pyramimonas_sp.AAC.1
MVFWEHEEHEVAYGWLRAFKMWPGNGVLGTKNTKRPTAGSGHSNSAWELCSGNGFLRIPKNSEGFLRIPGADPFVQFCPDPAHTPLGRQDAFF